MRILVTGSSGFIASKFIEKLKQRKIETTGLDIRKGKYTDIIYDIRNILPKLLGVKLLGIDHCFHFAAVANLDYAREHPLETIQVNVAGTGNVAEWCRLNNVMMNYISSCCVYGDTTQHPTHEYSPTRPTEIYGCTKLSAEYLVLGLHKLHSLTYNIIRPGSVYGPGMREELCIYKFIDWSMKDQPLIIHGTGEQTRSFIYIDDLVNGLVKILSRDIKNETFNLAGSQEISVLGIADLCYNVFHSVDRKYVEDRPGQVMKEQIDIEKARDLLDWEPRTFIQGFYATVDWMKKKRARLALLAKDSMELRLNIT